MLQGFTVGITSDRFREEQADYFARYGASVVVAPCLESTYLRSTDGLRQVTEGLVDSPPDVLIANTATGMRRWMVAAEGWGLKAELLGALGRTRIYPRGLKARSAIEGIGLSVQPQLAPLRLRDTIDLVVAQGWNGMKVVVQVDGSGSAPELAALRSVNAEIQIVSAYRWKMPDDRRPALRLVEGVIAGRVHAVTFTARPALLNWFTVATEEGVDGPLRQALARGDVTIGVMGPVCAEALAEQGIDPVLPVVPTSPVVDQLASAVCDRLRDQVVRTSRVGGRDGIVLAGMLATIEGEAYSLTPTEARFFGALMRRPNTVVSLEDLLRSVWEGEARDPHLVELVAARLRRRLGIHGDTVTSVPRRGYVLRV